MTDKESLGYKYAYGDEKNGIFVDLEKAMECYRQAGVPFRYRALIITTLMSVVRTVVMP